MRQPLGCCASLNFESGAAIAAPLVTIPSVCTFRASTPVLAKGELSHSDDMRYPLLRRSSAATVIRYY